MTRSPNTSGPWRRTIRRNSSTRPGWASRPANRPCPRRWRPAGASSRSLTCWRMSRRCQPSSRTQMPHEHQEGQPVSAATRLVIVVLAFVVSVPLSAALAGERGQNGEEEVSLPPTLITEGATPATELEATFTVSRSTTERGYGVGLSSVQYAPVPWFGLKLAVPFNVRDPRDTQ